MINVLIEPGQTESFLAHVEKILLDETATLDPVFAGEIGINRASENGSVVIGTNFSTEPGVDLKTFLMEDRITKLGKGYLGILIRDAEDHYLFFEIRLTPEPKPKGKAKRNPRPHTGTYVNVSRRKDGSLQPHFKAVKVDADFDIDKYVLEVCIELRNALKGLVEKK